MHALPFSVESELTFKFTASVALDTNVSVLRGVELSVSRMILLKRMISYYFRSSQERNLKFQQIQHSLCWISLESFWVMSRVGRMARVD